MPIDRGTYRRELSVKSQCPAGMTLVELLVVLAIIAAVAGVVTFSIATTLKKQQAKQCLTDMLMIEAAKDEYARDHPGAPQIIDDAEFKKYFRFGVPRCPLNVNEDYQDWDALGARVRCKVHGTIESLQAVP